MARDTFVADTPYKRLLVDSINRDISSLSAIYTLLRCEWIYQAAAHTRLLCESVITLRHIANDLETRVPQFLGYAYVEAYEITKSVLDQETKRAKPIHVDQLKQVLEDHRPDYERAKPLYTFVDRNGRRRPFSSWCRSSIAQQAQECGEAFVRLYEIVYSQLSAYVHGSAWSLRRQASYSRRGYNPRVVLTDVATVVRTTMVVWEYWARFCGEQLGWTLTEAFPEIVTRLDELDAKYSASL